MDNSESNFERIIREAYSEVNQQTEINKYTFDNGDTMLHVVTIWQKESDALEIHFIARKDLPKLYIGKADADKKWEVPPATHPFLSLIDRKNIKIPFQWNNEIFDSGVYMIQYLSLIHICRCRRYAVCRSRWSPYH
eukprot:TRINITY_DN11528_c0_g3_i3.p1 TRINITY_DN11528_c0_g3~~TRINITY_DN11528_c0_g3_i3.p1  ORF type:complete len:136 (-),score=10.65 TRINITY_DN11528_c0_g3_i3:12-419(-)